MQHSRKMKYLKKIQQTSEYDQKQKKEEAGSQREQTSGYQQG